MGNKTPFIYPNYIVDTLNQLMFKSAEEKDSFLYKSTDLVYILYNQFNEFPVTEQIYEMMWKWIYRMVDAKNDNWIKQYWNIANQYCMFKLENPYKEEEKECFSEFHIMVCTLLLYKQRYQVLRHALSFTNTLPAQYPLIPSSFINIFYVFENLVENKPEMYLEKYQMDEVDGGANNGNKIRGILADYFALLLVRLNDVNDYNITFSDPMEIPAIGSTIEENGYKIELAQELKNRLNKITEERIKACGLELENQKKALGLLDEFITYCEHTNKDLEKNGMISEEKRQYIKTELTNASSVNDLSLPIENNKEKGNEAKSLKNEENMEKLERVFSQQIKLDERLILSNHSSISSNISKAIISALNAKIRHFYYWQFLLRSAIKSFTIPYSNLEETLNRLAISSDYAILAIGTPSAIFDEIKSFSYRDKHIFYNASPVYEIPYHKDSVILIMRKEDVPCYRYLKIKDGLDSENEINPQTHLYSNIDTMKGNDLTLKVKQKIEISVPKQMRYVRLRIAYHLESDKLIISQISPIKSYIP